MKHRYPSYPYVNYKEGTVGEGAMVAFLQDFSNQLEGRLEDDLVPVGEITERLNDLMAYTDAMAEAKATGVHAPAAPGWRAAGRRGLAALELAWRSDLRP